jgi:hypothetical protein
MRSITHSIKCQRKDEKSVVSSRTLNFSALIYQRNEFLAEGKQTGHAIWPCSQLMCDFLQEQSGLIKNKRILELGSGLGICGSIAVVLGAKFVLFTDGDESVLEKCKRCAETNELGSQITDGEYGFSRIRWGEGEADNALPTERFDIIIGSDLLYGPRPKSVQGNDESTKDEADPRIKQLFTLVDSCLDYSPESMFLLAFERRDVSFDEIVQIAVEMGFEYSIPSNEYFEDIFGNRTEEMTDFWRACLFRFARNTKGVPSCEG